MHLLLIGLLSLGMWNLYATLEPIEIDDPNFVIETWTQEDEDNFNKNIIEYHDTEEYLRNFPPYLEWWEVEESTKTKNRKRDLRKRKWKK